MSRLARHDDTWGGFIEDTAALAGYVAATLFAFDVLCDFIAWVMA